MPTNSCTLRVCLYWDMTYVKTCVLNTRLNDQFKQGLLCQLSMVNPRVHSDTVLNTTVHFYN